MRDLLPRSARGKCLLHVSPEVTQARRTNETDSFWHWQRSPPFDYVFGKPLSSAMGAIGDSHLKNASDLISRLRNVEYKHKKVIKVLI